MQLAQIGQVPIQYVPERIITDTNSITLEPTRADLLVPSLSPFMPAPEPIIEVPDVAPWLWGAILFGAAFFWLLSPRR